MIEFRKVCAGYDRQTVLRDVDLTIPAGQVTAILGPNGSGKSTLLKAVVGLSELSGGEILLDGVPKSRYSTTEAARKVAYLPQSRRIPDISVKRLVLHGRFPHLGFPRKYRKEDDEIAMAALEKVGIADLADAPMARLSGGTRQKAYIAMALAQDTPAILLDEPTTYLDISHQLQVMELCRELAGSGKAVGVVLHDLDLAMQYADRLALFQRGTLAGCGTPEALFACGKLEQVFDVGICQVPTPGGLRYFCTRK